MAIYEKEITVTSQELELFSPVGTDYDKQDYPDINFESIMEAFDEIDNSAISKSWSYGPEDPYIDRVFSAKFDDGTIIDLYWTFICDDNDPNNIAHWYFGGAQFGNEDEVINDLGEETSTSRLEQDPVPDVVGNYVYINDDDTYIIKIVEE